MELFYWILCVIPAILCWKVFQIFSVTKDFVQQNANKPKYKVSQQRGHYESFFQRANHPTRPLGFWIRYTIYHPDNNRKGSLAELWAIFFDGESNYHTVAKAEFPLESLTEANSFQFSFNPNTKQMDVRINDAILQQGKLQGTISKNDKTNQSILWNLSFESHENKPKPVLLLPSWMYSDSAPFPKAKSMVGVPLASYTGSITLSESKETVNITNWIGSQNHNYGSKHTDLYSWGQVCGFDEDMDAFLEVATAQIKIGSMWTPQMTVLVLRLRNEEIAITGLVESILAGRKSSVSYFHWTFETSNRNFYIKGSIHANPQDFVALTYYNPPGGSKCCLNTKIAQCTLRVIDKRTNEVHTLTSKKRAAFELLRDDFTSHGIPVRV
mmetsp:Transcript_10339/g.14181  ORF Transcript_10339/g.14181 Transcript_10339/m.14181 type:complete len:383 (+) Transcript_10339:203-1351(+)